MKDVRAYDELINSLPDKNNRYAELNSFIKAHGLPLAVGAPSGETNEYPDRMDSEGPGGDSSAIFLKQLKLKPKSKFNLDEVDEVSSAKAKSASMKWWIPFNAANPVVGIEGDELLVSAELTPLCANGITVPVWLGIKPNGEYRAMAPKTAKDPKAIEDCPAKRVIQGSDYATCKELGDMMLKTKHILVWQEPMT